MVSFVARRKQQEKRTMHDKGVLRVSGVYAENYHEEIIGISVLVYKNKKKCKDL